MDKRGRLKVGIIILLILIGIFSSYFVLAGSSSGGSNGDSVTNVYNTYVAGETEDNEEEPEENEVTNPNNPGITGGIIGTGLFSNGIFVIIMGICAGLLVAFIISRTVFRVKKK